MPSIWSSITPYTSNLQIILTIYLKHPTCFLKHILGLAIPIPNLSLQHLMFPKTHSMQCVPTLSRLSRPSLPDAAPVYDRPKYNNKDNGKENMISTSRSVGWRPLGPIDFALQALRQCDPCNGDITQANTITQADTRLWWPEYRLTPYHRLTP